MPTKQSSANVAELWHNSIGRILPGMVAEQLLHASGHPALRRIACRYEDGVLTLEGRLTSFYQKQLAQSLVAKLDDVCRVDNRIEVVSAGPFRGPRCVPR